MALIFADCFNCEYIYADVGVFEPDLLDNIYVLRLCPCILITDFLFLDRSDNWPKLGGEGVEVFLQLS